MSEDQWTGWVAIIQPGSSPGTYGIEWQNAPAMERRGGWSGPYDSIEAARLGAVIWVRSWDMDPEKDLSIIVTDGKDPEA